ncbi:MAG: lipoprotein [Pseudomonadota bacterium]|nr:MAG: lipoprotein [Pseudomonadota bacterium]
MRPCWANWLLLAVVLVLGTSTMLGACGKKGPLYLPDKTSEPAR